MKTTPACAEDLREAVDYLDRYLAEDMLADLSALFTVGDPAGKIKEICTRLEVLANEMERLTGGNDPICPDCTNHVMEANWVCEQCGHRKAMPDRTLTPEEAWFLLGQGFDYESAFAQEVGRKIRTIAERTNKPASSKRGAR